MSATELDCGLESRRGALLADTCWNGIDYVEVADDQLSLTVYFFAPPKGITAQNLRIDGGRRITGIRITAVAPGASDDERGADSLQLTLDRYGDFSTYTLSLVDGAGGAAPVGFDPRYAAVDFSFKIGCAGDFDCATTTPCVTVPSAAPDIDYLAKDYESFRQLLLDRLATTLPQWRERHVPDIGITLVELLAHAADQLSAYQDAVATEAYLDTARTRISVRRHARLVNYRLHEGCNARTWLTIECSGNPTLPNDAYFVTAADEIAALGPGRERKDAALAPIPQRVYEVFEQACTGAGGTVLAEAYNRIALHTWGDQECCLRKGATRATLVDPAPPIVAGAANGTNGASRGRAAAAAPLPLKAGDVLIFEEVLGPRTGNPADADPTHRQAVRLTRVDYARDELLGVAIIEIEWAAADALRFPLCLSARLQAPDCRRIDGISVARGNVILVDHGRWVRGEALGCVGSVAVETGCGCDGAIAESIEQAAPFAPVLANAPLIYAEALSCALPAQAALEQDPRKALPRIAVSATDGAAGTAAETWNPCSDLLASEADARDVVIETDDDGRGHLRFGDDRCGRMPAAGACFSADYRIGVASAGNVARETIAYVVYRANVLDGAALKPRNPLPAVGGTAPETLAAAKLAAPRAFRSRLERAITADDYAQLAEAEPALQRAHAQLVWTGSWYEADVAIDPRGSEDAPAALLERVRRRIECARRAGHDLHVQPARYVPLAIGLHICVKPDYLAGQVGAAVLDVLGSGLRRDGRPAFFHPDNLSFGTDVYASDLIAAAQAVEGVQNVEVTELRRLDRAPAPGPVPDSLDLAPWEIAQVDNDPSFPEHGVLTLDIGGGR
jgi:hypothetical protein